MGARGKAPENFQILHPPDAWKQRFTTFFTAKGPVKLFQIWWSSHPFLTIPTKLPLIYLGTLLGAKEPSSNLIKQIPSHPYQQASLWFIWEPYSGFPQQLEDQYSRQSRLLGIKNYIIFPDTTLKSILFFQTFFRIQQNFLMKFQFPQDKNF